MNDSFPYENPTVCVKRSYDGDGRHVGDSRIAYSWKIHQLSPVADAKSVIDALPEPEPVDHAGKFNGCPDRAVATEKVEPEPDRNQIQNRNLKPNQSLSRNSHAIAPTKFTGSLRIDPYGYRPPSPGSQRAINLASRATTNVRVGRGSRRRRKRTWGVAGQDEVGLGTGAGSLVGFELAVEEEGGIEECFPRESSRDRTSDG
jgi:hypothetical protein